MISAFPYISEDGDRKVKYNDFRKLFSAYFTNGVFMDNAKNNLKVVAKSGMKVTVKAGQANINGVFINSDTDIDVQLDTASGNRVDRIVLRTDDTSSVRAPSIICLKGNPNAIALTRNGTIHDICLAEINVRSGSSSIVSSDIEDTRQDSALCGIVQGPMNSASFVVGTHQPNASELEEGQVYLQIEG